MSNWFRGPYGAIIYFCGLSRYKFVSGQMVMTPRFSSSSAAFFVASSLPTGCHLVGLSEAHSSIASICSLTSFSALVSFLTIHTALYLGGSIQVADCRTQYQHKEQRPRSGDMTAKTDALKIKEKCGYKK
jgi:hypothetical protein